MFWQTDQFASRKVPMYWCVPCRMVNIITDVSKDHIAFIFRVKYFKERYGEREREREKFISTA